MVKPNKELTKEWIMVMLYDEPQSLDSLTDIGCKTMFFGWEWDDLVGFLKEMNDDQLINQNANKWQLRSKAKFNIKKKLLLPIFQICEDPELLTNFKSFARSKCDTEFLDWVVNANNEKSKVLNVKAYARQNYEKITETVLHITKFLSMMSP